MQEGKRLLRIWQYLGIHLHVLLVLHFPAATSPDRTCMYSSIRFTVRVQQGVIAGSL